MTKSSGKRRNSLTITRPLYEVELFGGRSSVRIDVGQRVRLHPACDLWARGAQTAEVRAVQEEDGKVTVRVRPAVEGILLKGPLHTILPEHILVQ